MRSAQRLRLRPERRQRRFAGDHHGPELVSEGQAAHAKHPPNPNEAFGAGFFITLAALPVSLAIYKFTAQGTSDQPYFTRLIKDTYAEYAIKWARRNDIHTQAMQQAAADRVLFLNEPNQQVKTVDLRFPELVNAGSPYNVPAGRGSANLDELIAKYEKEARDENEKKLEQLKNNTVPVEQPVVQFRRVDPAVTTTPAS